MRDDRRTFLHGKGAIFLLLVLSLLFSACAGVTPITPPAPETTYAIHTDSQSAFLSGDCDLIDRYADGKAEKSRPLPVTINFADYSEYFTQIELSKNFSFDSSFLVKIEEEKAEVYNLEVGEIYYWRGVKASGEKGEIHAFRTEDVCPRNLYIDGVTNARDLGGYQTENGRIRQGMLYRTARLNQNKADTPTPIITEKGKKTMVDTLKVKTEIDLRRISDNEIGSLSESVLGAGVRYENCPMVASDAMLTENNASLRKFFSLLADESNYPIFFHCSIGTDRTGYCSFLVLSLLGVSNEEIYHDYLFSNFGSIGGDRTAGNVMGFSLFLSLQKGSTPAEKAESLLLFMGVTQEEIDEIRRILTE